MSGLKLISPLLDRFAVGDAISNHNGVRCYPAMRDDSDEKYIVKVVSIPASQVQLDALLLTGAYRDQASALAYFKELADSAVQEAEMLQKLSKLEGFIAYEAWQVVKMEDGVGYDVYLLGTYKRSLERHLSRNPMTHLSAINMGLDLCSALAVCRRAGCLYVDLKPSNVYISDSQTYRIGDLGIIPMDALRYASLPDRYRSSYTAPEIQDAFSALNETMDIYALGLILYQAYNNGELPFEGNAPSEALPAPMYADYEMSEIILKACALNPEDRWQDPSQMGQALVGYMQRNGAKDIPIIPPVVEEEAPVEEFFPEEDNDQETVEEIELQEQIALDEFQNEEPESTGPAGEAIETEDSTEEPTEDEDAADLSFISKMVSDETAPDEDTAFDLDDADLTDEMSAILAQADELISHETPDPVVAPDPIEIPMPEPIVLKEESPEEPEESAEENPDDSQEDEDSNVLQLPEDEEEAVDEEPEIPRKRGKGWIAIVVVLLLLAALALGGAYFYKNYYLQTVSDINLDGYDDQLVVTLDTKIPDQDLTIVCTDTYGISTKYAVHNSAASISGLNPATTYSISVEIEGFHQLIGKTTASYTTAAKTNIVSFTAITGPSDGSVILNFTPDGPEPENWSVVCTADGQQPKIISFSGHTVTVTDLAVDKLYTFTLNSDEGLFLDGTYSITYQVTKVLYAQNLRMESMDGNILTLAWDNPEGYENLKWNLTHYNGAGDIVSVSTVETEYKVIELSDLTQSNTFELMAEGMTQSNKISLSANPVIIQELTIDYSNSPVVSLTWNFEGTAPASGWIVSVTADGSEPLEVLTSDTNSVDLNFLIPGATYEITIQTGDDTTVFNPVKVFDAPEIGVFDDYWITSSDIEVSLINTPTAEEWTYKDLKDEDFLTTFVSNAKATLVLHLNRSHADSYQRVQVTVVIRDVTGAPVHAFNEEYRWSDMWDNRYFFKNLTELPQDSGNYTIEVFFNGNDAGSQELTIQ